MSDVSRGAEVLARLKPPPKHRSKNREAIEALRGPIYAKKDEGCTWAQIAETLAEANIVISAAALRFAINAEKRDFKKYPRRRKSSAATNVAENGASGDTENVPANEGSTDAPGADEGEPLEEALAKLKSDSHLDMKGPL
jgi:hypothetical protein